MHAMKANVEWRLWRHSFLTSASYRCEWSASLSGCFIPRKISPVKFLAVLEGWSVNDESVIYAGRKRCRLAEGQRRILWTSSSIRPSGCTRPRVCKKPSTNTLRLSRTVPLGEQKILCDIAELMKLLLHVTRMACFVNCTPYVPVLQWLKRGLYELVM